MAAVIDPRWRVTDLSGNAVVGATATVYDAGTTTPGAIYSDAGLTTPISLSGANATDAQGYFPQFFAAEGAVFDITIKDSGGATVTDRTYVSVPALGSDTGTFTRDLTGSRFKLRNVGGVVYIEAGNATGDDVGGSMRLGGWAGTQLDSLTADAATFNTTGTITENSKKLPGVVYAAQPFTAVSTLDIALPNSPTGLTSWDLELFQLLPSGTPDLTIRFSTDNGANYNASSGYAYTNMVLDAAASTPSAATGATSAKIASALDSTAVARCRLTINVPPTGIGLNQVHGAFYKKASTTIVNAYIDGLVRATNIRILVSTGTLTGRYRLTPQRGTGD